MKRNDRVRITQGKYKGKEGFYLNLCSEPEFEGRHYVKLFKEGVKIAVHIQQFEVVK